MSGVNELMLFLSKHRKEESEKATHTGIYLPLKGSWTIPNRDIDEFWTLYTNAYKHYIEINNRFGVGLTEVMQDCSPVLIDLDMKTPIHEGAHRKYTDNDIIQIVQKYQEIINLFVSVHDDDMIASVFEKPAPRLLDNETVKDGVHIMFNKIVVDKKIHKIIHEYVREYIKTNNLFGHLSKNELIDTCSVTNNWMLYGSVKKEDPCGYILTKEIDTQGMMTISSNENIEPKVFSIQRDIASQNDLTELGREIISSTSAPMQHVFENVSMNAAPDMESISCEKDVEQHTQVLLSLLSSSRYDDEPSWIRVGWCLRNICADFLPIWEEWSKKSTKFVEGECEKRWIRFRNTGYNISSLSYWARSDNQDAYEEYIKQRCKSVIEYSINCGAHYDIARILYYKYQDVFKSTNPKKSDEWFIFEQHRWREMPGGYILMNKISSELGAEFQALANKYKKCMINKDPKVVSDYTDKRNKCNRLAYQVKDNGFKSGVLKECTRMFFDEHFSFNLDSNPSLLGFENGVYDIKNLVFRDGAPDDFVSKSTGLHYMELSEDDTNVKQVIDFISKVQPKNDLREYLLTVLSTFLNGDTEEQTFQIWTGSGSNGKSTIVELFEKTLGDDYCGKFPVTLLTRDRSNSNACTPELQDVAKKRFASMQEPNDNDTIFTGAMKEYTGGDKLYSRGLYAKPTPFKPQFKLVLLCNRMPIIKGWDYGTWRRIRVLNFTSSFVDVPKHSYEYLKDKSLPKKFDEWREAFMWILIKKLETYMKKGMKYPEDVLKASNEYKKKNDIISHFIDDSYHISHDDNIKLAISDFYANLKIWWKNFGDNKSVPSRNDIVDYLTSNTKLLRPPNNRYMFGIEERSKMNEADLNDRVSQAFPHMATFNDL